VQTTLTGGKTGEKECFAVTLVGEGGCGDCTIEVCPELPDCCAIVKSETTTIPCKNGTYTYTATVTNNTNSSQPFIYFYPPAGVTFTPDHFAMTQPGGLPSGATSPPLTITITGAKPGEFCFDVSLHTEAMKDCCSSPHHCIKLLPCDIHPQGAP
jgi:hypothetical protein